MIPVAFINLVSGYIFYEFEFEKPAVWIAVYASLSKSIWGIFGTVLVIGIALNTGGMCCFQLVWLILFLFKCKFGSINCDFK